MELDERIGWLLLGMAVGFVLGYIVRSLRDIKEELDEVDELVRRQNESGFARNPVILDVVLLIVVALTVWAAFASQALSNQVQQTQRNQTQSVVCNKQYLRKTIVALNQRTSYVQHQTLANIKLQTAQRDFFLIIFEHPRNDKIEIKAFKEYLDSLKSFVRISHKVSGRASFVPYPTATDLSNCLEEN